MPSATVDNPLSAGMPKTLLPQPCLLVIFGAAGDLSWRKLLPAVYNLNVDGVLPAHFAVVCFGLPSTEEGKSAANPDDYIRKRARDGISRFPDDFTFQLTNGEFRVLKSEIVTSNWGGLRRATPLSFHEQGVAMLSSVLRSRRAIRN